MARSIKSPIADRGKRLDLTPRGKPYHFTVVDRGVALGYRRVTAGDGSWVVRGSKRNGLSWQKVLLGVVADDYQNANGKTVMDFHQAAAAARSMARGPDDTGDEALRDKPLTNRDALISYKAGHADSRNATRVLKHLPEWLGNMPIASSTEKHYRDFVKLLVGKGLAASSIKRTCNNFAAALVLAARDDKRITNSREWKQGLAHRKSATGNSGAARNYATDAQIIDVIAACYERDPALGLFTEVAAQTGSRPIQIARLQVASLHFDPAPFLMMPPSDKGKKDSPKPARLPITQELADRLRQAAHRRRIVDPLLLQANGKPWCAPRTNGVMTVSPSYREPFDEITAALGLDDQFSFYGLRHCSIIRQLQTLVSPQIVAKAHDTSVAIIERHYGAYIVDLSDALIRATLLDTSPTLPAANVIPLHR